MGIRVGDNWNPKVFQAFIMPITETGCWIWMGGVRNNARNKKHGSTYGIIADPKTNKPIQAHRFSWKLHKGEIEGGKMVLHKCDVSLCVNPDHLYLGDAKDNGNDIVKRNRKWKSHCKRGHERTEENTSYQKVGDKLVRSCRLCIKESRRKSYALKRQKEIAC